MLDELNEGQLVRILTEPKNALIKQYAKMFALDGISLQFDQEALHAVAKLARARKTNGRALRSVLEARLLRTQFNLPDLRDQGVEQIIIRASTITDGAEPEMVYKAKANL
jgi:ATP-dependent Clp protease ATP-binding subunit ClpX